MKGDQTDHMSHKLSEKLHKLGPCQRLLTVNHKVRPDTDVYLGSSMYFKYEADNVVLVKSRVLC